MRLLALVLLLGPALVAGPALAAPPPKAEEAPPEPLPLTKNPELVEMVQAAYPPEAEAAGLEAVVGLLIEIDATGAVSKVEVLRPAGHGFDEAAVEAARQFRFHPAEDANGPTPVAVEFDYGFKLTPAEAGPEAGAPAPTTAAPPGDPALPVNLEGSLTEMGTRRPLAGFVVRHEPSGLEATTDGDGRWAFHGVPEGLGQVRVVRPGYDTASEPVDIRAGTVVDVQLWIRNQSYTSPEIVAIYRQEKDDVTVHSISMDEVRKVPGTFGDPVRVVQSLPGAARAPFGTGLLVIRGSNPEDSAVYVDGVRIPFIYHLGGYESVINPDLVGGVDYLPGGYGPEYGRTLGGVVEVRTTTTAPERTKITWSTDLLDSGAMVAGRVGKEDKVGYGFAARRSYIDAVLPLVLRNSAFVVRPYWWDYQAKVQHLSDVEGNRASIAVFGFQDKLLVGAPDGVGGNTDQDTQGDLGTTYETHRVVAAFDHGLAEGLALDTVLAFGVDGAKLQLGNEWNLDQWQWLAEARAELPWTPNEHVQIAPGVDFLGGWAKFSVELPLDPTLFAETDPLAEREPFTLSNTQTAWSPDVYLEARLRPFADPDAFLLSPGIRYSYIVVPGEAAADGVDPRLSFRARVSPSASFKGSTGVYTQPPQPFQMYRQDDQRVELDVQRAFASSIGWEQSVGEPISGSVEVFYKWSEDLIVDNPELDGLEDQFFINDGVGRAYGFELMLRHEPVGRFFGWISYTWSRSLRRDHPGDDWYPFDYDQPHIFSAQGGYKLPYDFELGAKIAYTSGNPTTPYSLGVYDIDQDSYQGFSTSATNSERLPPNWSVSVRIDKLFTFKAWQLDLYLDVINALHGQNPEFEQYNYDYTESYFIKGLPIIPSPGFEAKFEF